MTEPPTLQAVLAAHLGDQRLNARQRAVYRHLLACRTPALGGVQLGCDRCPEQRLQYFSCRDRHCPHCQHRASARWQAREHRAVLPVPYHHLVFTLPHALNGWVALHPRALYALLFEAVWATLGAFATRRLGGQLGMLAVLHTWGENLTRHVHLHALVPAGALGADGHWRPANGGYLFPVRALARRLRGRLVSRLRAQIAAGALPRLTDPAQVDAVLDALMATDWVVYSKPCLAHSPAVVDYLARYTHRIALSEARLLALEPDGRVRLAVKDYAEGGRRKALLLAGPELVRRFLLHVLPKGFQRVRHYGFLANRCRAAKLAAIRTALDAPPEAEPASDAEPQGTLSLDGYPCPRCPQGRLHVIGYLAPQRLDGG